MIPIPSPATLIRMKDTPRPQDAIDRAFLEGVLREREARASAEAERCRPTSPDGR